LTQAKPSGYSFTRYLASKKSLDDRALNGHVWQALKQALPFKQLAVLEVGAGIGTMVERLLERQVLANGVAYTAIDAEAANIKAAQQRLDAIPSYFTLELEAVDLFDFAAREQGRRSWDLLIAHAFLDLVDLQSTLPLLFDLIKPGGLFYFTLNFDGGTIFQPVIEAASDEKISALYHRTMDERLTNGRPAGHSQTGRRLFESLTAAGGQIIASGSSDWVLFAGKDGYPEDEAYFLHFIVHTIDQALTGHPELDPGPFKAWIAQRHAQIEVGTLVYIAHQLDFCGRRPGS
jgi:SAM-dependent methyltransferase